MAPDEKRRTDWEAIEREYRAGQLSTREIARQHGVSHVAVNKKAKVEGWTRDLSKRVRQEVTTRLVTSEVTSDNAREAVDQAAARGVEIVRQHRGSLGKAHRIVQKLLAELEEGTDNRDEIEEEIMAHTIADHSTQRRNAMLKAVSLPSRAATARELSQTIKNLIPLERQAFNLDGSDDDDAGSDTEGAFATIAKALDLAAAGKARSGGTESEVDQSGPT